jgi:hypothetical protein
VIVVVAGEIEKSPVPTAVTVVLFALFTVTEKVAGLPFRETVIGEAGKSIVQAIGVAEGEGDGEADGEGEAEGDGEADGEGEAEGDGEADGEGEAEGDGEGDADGDGEGDGEGDAEGDGLGDGEPELLFATVELTFEFRFTVPIPRSVKISLSRVMSPEPDM